MKQHPKGFTLLEVLMALALLVTITVGTIAGNNIATRGTRISQQRAEANRLAQEAMEAVHSVRAESFTAINPGTYHPVKGSSGWELASGNELIGSFSRQIIVSQVYRSLACTEGICEIVEAGGIVDEGSLKAEVQVRWEEAGQNRELDLETLITYWR